MKAMVLEHAAPIETAPLRLRDVPVPEPGPGEVRLRVTCCAVCRTDLHVIEGDLPEAKRPIIPGHQIVGVVDRLGPGCRLQAGARVGVAWLRHTCGGCGFCAEGKENLCEASRYTGYHEDGGYAEYAVVKEDFTYALPETFADGDAAPLLCSGIIGYRALKRSGLRPGGSIALYGFGGSAHVVIQIAKHRACRVYVVSRGEAHQELARELGADWAGADPAGMPEYPEAAILFAPVGTLVPVALAHLRKGGTLAIAGIHLTDVPPLNYEHHLFYERDIHSVTANTREDGRGLLEEAAAIPIRPRTKRYALEETNQALLDLKSGSMQGSGVVHMA